MKQNTPTPLRPGFDLAEIRSRLSAPDAPTHWRGIEELAETDEFLGYLRREFPEQAAEWSDPATRRDFLKVAAASLALAGVTGCSYQPQEKIIPYVKSPEEIVQGKPLYYASSSTLSGYATGLLVESNDGRPTNIAGNPEHPASKRGVDTYSIASLIGLYDPDRSAAVLRNGRPSTWEDFQAALLNEYETRKAQPAAAARVRVVTPAVGSPSLADQARKLVDALPGSKWVQYEPASRDNIVEGARLATGKAAEPVYKLENARVILSLAADFLGTHEPGHLTYSMAFADLRDPDKADGTIGEMNRLYAVDPSLTSTSAAADHRLPLTPSQIGVFARALAAELGVAGVDKLPATLPDEAAAWIPKVAADLKAHNGQALVIVGPTLPPAVHALGVAINAALGAPGKTLQYIDPIVAGPTAGEVVLKELVDEINQGKVDLLVLLGVNPVYDAPADLDFRSALETVKTRVHAGHYLDETGELCHWHAPLAHYLEAWGDGRSFDGTVTFQQPLIQPMNTGRSEAEILAMFRGERNPSGREILETYWKAQPQFQADAANFETKWRVALHGGFLPDTAAPAAESGELKPAAEWLGAAPEAAPGVELIFEADPSVFDGRFSNNAWLQELPKPLSKLVWDNVVAVSPALAADLNVASGDIVKLDHNGRSVEAPVWIDPGHAPGAATITLGYGRKKAGRVGTGVGFNAYALRTSSAPWAAGTATLERTSRTYLLATTQSQGSLEGRNHVREASLEEYRSNPHFVEEMELMHGEIKSIYPAWKYEGYAWGMAIDLSRCFGCSSCIVACQSENNIVVVGKDQVSRKRALHWLEIDRYYSGAGDQALANPTVSFQPRMCMHCENAPCEVVCPVAATVHDHEGLNNMVYNRCVGTRYCSNNCPYKVRKFNFLRFSEHFFRQNSPTGKTADSPLTLMMNPDVTIRPRGVMEKCTYCVQRISEAKIQSQLEDRKVRDGEIVTACEGACPTRAITFGDLNNPDSRVARLKQSPRNYAMLKELNTAPRTTYLAGLRNPNPELEVV